MMIEIAARYLHDIRNVREGGMLVPSLIEQLIGNIDNVLTGCFIAHRITFSAGVWTRAVCCPALWRDELGRLSYSEE
jgi:hypothetical protein